MKQLILSGLVLALITSSAFADEKSDAKFDAKTDGEAEVETSEAADETDDEWKPRFMISLQTSVEETNTPQERTIAIPFYKTEYEERTTSNGKKQRIPIRKLGYRNENVMVQPNRNATMFCDAVNVSLSNSKTAGCEFECPGKLHLFAGAMSITAASGSLKDGRLHLVDAEIKQMGSVTATSEKLTLILPLHGMSTDTFDCTIPDALQWSLLTPAAPIFEPRSAQPFGTSEAFYGSDSDDDVPIPKTEGIKNFKGASFPPDPASRRAAPFPRNRRPIDDLGVSFDATDHFGANDPLPAIIH